jgi:hypothetical protein
VLLEEPDQFAPLQLSLELNLARLGQGINLEDGLAEIQTDPAGAQYLFVKVRR